MDLSDFSSDAGYVSWEEELDDDVNLLRPCTHSLGLNRQYAPAWTRQDAFREFYQNWKDAIIASFNLEPRAFRPELKHTAQQIQISVFRPAQPNATKQLLGYILFKKKAGSIELTNFKAELSRDDLLLGTTSKLGEERFAGCHGEGFKIASLVMRRRGHAVRFASQSYYWNFRFSGEYNYNFVCALSQANAERVTRQKNTYAQKVLEGKPRGLTSNIWEDVTVQISKARGEFGEKVSEAAFVSWLGVTLDINGPDAAEMVQTSHGDLILDKQFLGRVYLKGLAVPGLNQNARNYVFGYNFHHGKINRDRERLRSATEEARMLAKIWEESMIAKGDTVIDKYIQLFHDHEQCLDIDMVGKNISISASTNMWNRLQLSHPGKFFYASKNDLETEDTSQTDIIRNDLQKEPCNLPIALWRILRDHSLVRTADEERHNLFTRSEEVTCQGQYSFNVHRALRASMLLTPQLHDMQIQFVTGANTSIDLIYNREKKSIQIHQKWIDFEKSHENVSCDAFSMRGNRSVGDDFFSCDHIVEDLFELVVGEVRESLSFTQTQCWRMRRAARHLMQCMPRMIQVSQTPSPNQLKVTWVGNESASISKTYGEDIRYLIILHKMSTCQSERAALLNIAGAQSIDTSSTADVNGGNQSSGSCSCDRHTSFDSSGIYFHGLDSREQYFAIVARTEAPSLFGVPSLPISPTPQITSRVEASPTTRRAPNSTPSVARTIPPTLANERAPLSPLNRADAMDESESDRSEDSPILRSVNRHQTNASSDGRLNRDHSDSQLAFEEDTNTWENWHVEALRILSSMPDLNIQATILQKSSSSSAIECPGLQHSFEVGDHAYIRLNSSLLEEFIIYVHDIRYRELDMGKPLYFLLVRKYSFLRSSQLFKSKRNGVHNSPIDGKELLLHFSDLKTMGERGDAEFMLVDDIYDATTLEVRFGNFVNEVAHVGPTIAGLDGKLFCRFAINKARDGTLSCITPIAPSMLQNAERQAERSRRPKFSFSNTSLVFDLTANILGPAEGFQKAGYTIHAGIESEYTHTWKVRYPKPILYDGSALNVLDDLKAGRLDLPSSDPDLPRIAIMAGALFPFRLNKKNKLMPSEEEFLRPIHLPVAAADSEFKPHFIVLTTHSAVLHDNTVGTFSNSVLQLLQHNYAVHLELSTLQEHGLPQDKSVLVMVAAPPSVWVPLRTSEPFPGSQPPGNIGNIIDDLVFKNPRAGQGTKEGAVCFLPRSGEPNSVPPAGVRLVHNHQTGRPAKAGCTPLNMDTTTVTLPPHGAQESLHPTRMDLLTVREIARLQGLDDDFEFRASEERQRVEALSAVPPIVAQRAARAISKAITGTRAVRVVRTNGGGQSGSGYKRPRVDSDDGQGE